LNSSTCAKKRVELIMPQIFYWKKTHKIMGVPR
jgi:hypothetical protein